MTLVIILVIMTSKLLGYVLDIYVFLILRNTGFKLSTSKTTAVFTTILT